MEDNSKNTSEMASSVLLVSTVTVPLNETPGTLRRAMLALAMALEADGKPTEAIAAFRRVVEVAPHWKWAYMHLGRLLSNAGELEASEAILRRWTVRSPKDPVGWSNLALSLRRRGRTSDAIAAYTEACELDPKNAKYRMSLGAAIWMSDPARAAAAYQRATALAPRNADAWHYLGRMLQAQRKYREALDAFNRAQSLTINRPQWTHRAENARRQKRCQSMVSKPGSDLR